MPKDPMELVKASKFNMVPIMIGHTKDEGVLFSSKFLSDSNSLQYLDKYFEALASILMLNKSIDDGIGEDESVSKILKVFKVHIF